uniref:Uncharacterized protein n=1 Tax=Anguilla anguilla TaxID=7936 RepID=A0A0E9PIN0_ANGAN
MSILMNGTGHIVFFSFFLSITVKNVARKIGPAWSCDLLPNQ